MIFEGEATPPPWAEQGLRKGYTRAWEAVTILPVHVRSRGWFPLLVALIAAGSDEQSRGTTARAGIGSQAEPALPSDAADPALQFWPQWRGPLATGFAPQADPPLTWSETENVRWKTALPGLGHSSPIVWGARVFVTTALAYGEEVEPVPDRDPGAHDNAPLTQARAFFVLALRRDTGTIEWRTEVRAELPHEGAHESASFASASPVTDGERVFAFFGSRGLYCLDVEGGVLWSADFGEMRVKHGHGEGASPALHGQTLLVNWDHEEESFLLALDKETGEERWRIARDEATSWATPIVIEHAGRAQAVVSGTKRVRGYDLETGAVLWECGGLSSNIVASPVYGDGMVFAGSSYERQALLAIRLEGASGDITDGAQLVWVRRRGTPYVPSPLLYGDALYFLQHYQALLSRVLTRDGSEPARATRIEGLHDIYASPVGAAGRIYVTDLDGMTAVLSHAPEPKTLALNQLDDSFAASADLIFLMIPSRCARILTLISSAIFLVSLDSSSRRS